MVAQQWVLLVINILGGAAVIGSYIYGVASHPGSGNALWGGVPASTRPVYTVSMILSALGYFAFIAYMFFRVEPGTAQIAGRFGFTLFHLIFIGMLLPSALWMPFTHLYIANPGTGIWVGIRIVLLVVGISSCALVWALLTLNMKEPAGFYWLAVAGAAWFAFHTLVLDGILWPLLYRSS